MTQQGMHSFGEGSTTAQPWRLTHTPPQGQRKHASKAPSARPAAGKEDTSFLKITCPNRYKNLAFPQALLTARVLQQQAHLTCHRKRNITGRSMCGCFTAFQNKDKLCIMLLSACCHHCCCTSLDAAFALPAASLIPLLLLLCPGVEAPTTPAGIGGSPNPKLL